jgi:2-polyprenyl-3-methyl-5-hydroxy-6-metoxy-1,4-benzoquinol methylase
MSKIHESCIVCQGTKLKCISGYEKDHLVRCASCGMVFSVQIPSNNEIDGLYANYSYCSESKTSPITINRYEELLTTFESFRKTNKILDFGCGRGDFLLSAKKNNWEIYGYETSEQAIFLLSKLGINVLQDTDIVSDDCANSFDVIVSMEVLEHTIQPVHIIKNIFKLLRPGGILYITVPNFNSIGRLRMKGNYPIICYPEHISFFTKKSIRVALKRTGFSYTSTRTTGIQTSFLKRKKTAGINLLHDESNNSNEILRSKFERPFMKLLKRMINFCLSILGIGETLKVTAIK